MADRLRLTELQFDVIVPVPMHRTKQKKRGFNHAALIGKYLAGRTGTVCLAEALERTVDTRPMRGLSPTERENNIRGHIAPGPDAWKLRGKRVLVLDDFFTTGSTARECRRAMAAVQPAEVMLIAFAAKY
jgi:predicted amidophosphoribosyltransferase